MFDSTSELEQSIIIGSIREVIAKQCLKFLPVPICSGWIYDISHNYTGQIDLILKLSEALNLPATIIDDGSISGVLASQTIAAIEVKSNISSDIKKIVSKTWECHRLQGGLGSQSSESYKGLEVKFELPQWVPICVIGSGGFSDITKYNEHINDFKNIEYSINKNRIDCPDSTIKVTPDILIDFKYDSILLQNYFEPKKLLVPCFGINDDQIIEFDNFTGFRNLKSGESLMILVYCLNILRGDLTITQMTEDGQLLNLFEK